MVEKDENKFVYNDDKGDEHSNLMINLEILYLLLAIMVWGQGSLGEIGKFINFWEWWHLTRKAGNRWEGIDATVDTTGCYQIGGISWLSTWSACFP